MRIKTDDQKLSSDARVLELTGGTTSQTEVDGHVAVLGLGSAALFIDARTFGVKADRVTDDGPAIQAAMDAAATNPYGMSNANDFSGAIVQLPAGRMKITTPLKMNANVWLRGHGPSATYIEDAGNATDTFQLKTGNEVQVMITDLGVIKTGTNTGGYCINLTNTGGASILGDQRHVLDNLVLVQPFRGVYTQGNTEVRLNMVTVQRATDASFRFTGTDMFVTNCTAGGQTATNQPCFYVFGGNSRFAACKAYGASLSPGFSFGGGGRHQASAIEVQDCNQGIQLSQADSVIISAALIDSCGNGVSIGFQSPSSGMVEAMVVNRGGAFNPTSGLHIQSSDGFNVRLTCSDETGSNPFPAIVWDGSGRGTVIVNYQEGQKAVAYAAAVTPDPFDGGTLYIGSLTGALTLNNPASPGSPNYMRGTRLTFALPQDSTGGRVVSFGTLYKTTGAITTTLSTTTTITFVWDGTNWREASRAVT